MDSSFFIKLFSVILITCIAIHQVSSRPIGTIKCYKLLGEDEDPKTVNKRQVECPSSILQGTGGGSGRVAPVLTAEQREERKRQIFEGLLHFATVVNHIDTFVMDKGKLFLKSLGKMVASEEDPRFDM